MMLFFILNFYIDNSLRLPAGIQSTGTGGISTVIDEGLSVFHNSALIRGTTFNFLVGRWFYGTSLITFGVSYKDNALGINYLSYGEIQGYDEYGIPTNKFSPYDLNIGYARRFGSIGLCIKNFQTKIDSVLYSGLAGGISSYIEFGNLGIGAKIDNLGAEFIHKVSVPLITATGLRYVLSDDFEIFAEVRGLNFELSSGLLYKYQNLRIFTGMKYIKPADYIEQISISDFWFSGGITITFDEYVLGYSFTYTEISNAHQIGIKFIPRL